MILGSRDRPSEEGAGRGVARRIQIWRETAMECWLYTSETFVFIVFCPDYCRCFFSLQLSSFHSLSLSTLSPTNSLSLSLS